MPRHPPRRPSRAQELQRCCEPLLARLQTRGALLNPRHDCAVALRDAHEVGLIGTTAVGTLALWHGAAGTALVRIGGQTNMATSPAHAGPAHTVRAASVWPALEGAIKSGNPSVARLFAKVHALIHVHLDSHLRPIVTVYDNKTKYKVWILDVRGVRRAPYLNEVV